MHEYVIAFDVPHFAILFWVNFGVQKLFIIVQMLYIIAENRFHISLYLCISIASWCYMEVHLILRYQNGTIFIVPAVLDNVNNPPSLTLMNFNRMIEKLLKSQLENYKRKLGFVLVRLKNLNLFLVW